MRPVDVRRQPRPVLDAGPSLLAPLTEDEMHQLLATPIRTQREPNVIQLTRCPVCREWARAGSYASGHCQDCGHPINAAPVK